MSEQTEQTQPTSPTDETTGEALSRLVAVVECVGRPARDVAADLMSAEADHGPGLTAKQVGNHMHLRTPGKVCGCATCLQQDRERLVELTDGPWWMTLQGTVGMIVCETCGNKRCPHATHHDQPCSGSNEPGQAGSRYA